MKTVNECPVCSSGNIEYFFETLHVPVHIGILWPTIDDARNCPKGDIKLAFCRDCGVISNLAFDPALMEYSQSYDNSLCYSACFNDYAQSLASQMIKRYGLRNKDIIEIGSGKGDFLRMLCELGGNRGVGFDPSYEGNADNHEDSGQVRFIRDMYSERYASYRGDFIYCRQVLEHISDPVSFLRMIRGTVGKRPGTVVFFEVPNAVYNLNDMSISDIIYEHCSYFSLGSLSHMLASCGFEVRERDVHYGKQFISVGAVICDGNRKDTFDDTEDLAGSVAAFADRYNRKIQQWRGILDHAEQAGKKAVIWGGGARGVSFMNMLGNPDQIKYAVDINPNKQGNYLAGSGQRIVSPDFLKEYKPDIVFVINPIYTEEIRRDLSERGINTEVMDV